MLGGEVAGLGQPTRYGPCASDRRSLGAWTERAPNLHGREGVNRMRFRITVHEDRSHQVTANTVSSIVLSYALHDTACGQRARTDLGSGIIPSIKSCFMPHSCVL